MQDPLLALERVASSHHSENVPAKAEYRAPGLLEPFAPECVGIGLAIALTVVRRMTSPPRRCGAIRWRSAKPYSLSGLMGLVIRLGSLRQSTPGTSM